MASSPAPEEDLEELFVVVRRNGDGTYYVEPKAGTEIVGGVTTE